MQGSERSRWGTNGRLKAGSSECGDGAKWVNLGVLEVKVWVALGLIFLVLFWHISKEGNKLMQKNDDFVKPTPSEYWQMREKKIEQEIT